MRAVVDTGERWRRTEVAEVGRETRTGAMGSWAGAGAYPTRVSEAHCSEIVAERVGTGSGKRVWPEARAQDMGWEWAQNVVRTGEYTGTKYCGKVECKNCVGTQTKVGVKLFLIVKLNPAKHRLHW